MMNLQLIIRKHKEDIMFFTFISPWLIGFICLTLFPMLVSLCLMFFKWDGVGEIIFVGTDNIQKMLFYDAKFWLSLKNTIYFVLFSVPLNVITSLILAVLLNVKYKGTSIFRSFFYLPSVTSGAAIFIVWGYLYNGSIGPINYLLSLVGIQGPNWLTDPAWAMPAIILMTVAFCGSTMIIFLAGLQDVPLSIIESAKVDGASRLLTFFRITLPIISPVILFNLIVSLIGSLQVFAQPFIMTGGGPVDTTYVYGMIIYQNAFFFNEFGYASVLAWFLFIIIMVLTFIIIKTSSWVYTENN